MKKREEETAQMDDGAKTLPSQPVGDISFLQDFVIYLQPLIAHQLGAVERSVLGVTVMLP